MKFCIFLIPLLCAAATVSSVIIDLPKRSVRQVVPAATIPAMYIPLAVPTASSGPSANETSDIVEGKLKSTESKLNGSLDDVKRTLADKSSHLETKLDEKLNAAVAKGQEHLSSVSQNLDERSKSMQEKLDTIQRRVDLLMEMHIAENHHEDKFKEIRDRLNKLNEALVAKHEADDREKKARKDEDIKRNIEVLLEAPDDENPSVTKLLPLTPIVAARKLRQAWNAQMGKGMVSVCYHNQPKPLADEHPLVDNDDAIIRSIFNGTMDSAHNLQAGLNLDTPTYINSLLMEVRSLDRQYVSLCLENPDRDVEFYHDSACMNLLVRRRQ